MRLLLLLVLLAPLGSACSYPAPEPLPWDVSLGEGEVILSKDGMERRVPLQWQARAYQFNGPTSPPDRAIRHELMDSCGGGRGPVELTHKGDIVKQWPEGHEIVANRGPHFVLYDGEQLLIGDWVTGGTREVPAAFEFRRGPISWFDDILVAGGSNIALDTDAGRAWSLRVDGWPSIIDTASGEDGAIWVADHLYHISATGHAKQLLSGINRENLVRAHALADGYVVVGDEAGYARFDGGFTRIPMAGLMGMAEDEIVVIADGVGRPQRLIVIDAMGVRTLSLDGSEGAPQGAWPLLAALAAVGWLARRR